MPNKIESDSKTRGALISIKIAVIIISTIILFTDFFLKTDLKFTNNFTQKTLLFTILFIAIGIKNRRYLKLSRNKKVFFYDSLNLYTIAILSYGRSELFELSNIEMSKSRKAIETDDGTVYRDYYSIYINDEQGVVIKFYESNDYAIVRRVSEKISKIFQHDIVDKSFRGENLRRFSNLDKSYIIKLKERKRAVSLPNPEAKPDSMVIEENNYKKIVTVTPKGNWTFLKMMIIIFSVLLFIPSVLAFLQMNSGIILLCVFLFLFSIIFTRYLYLSPVNIYMILSKEEISIKRGKLFKKTFKIKDIEDIKIIGKELWFIKDKNVVKLNLDDKRELSHIKRHIDYHYYETHL